jgi:hypothetical protein
MAFTDVDITIPADRHDSYVPLNLHSMCISQFRKRPLQRFKFTNVTEESDYEVTNETIKKLRDSWQYWVTSDAPFSQPLTYFEIELVAGNTYGIYIGVTSRDHTHNYFDGNLKTDREIALYTSSHCNMHRDTVIKIDQSFTEAKNGDVVGVVVDTVQNEVFVYLNGKLLCQGIKKPKDFGELSILISLYYSGTEIRLCNKYPLESLRQ